MRIGLLDLKAFSLSRLLVQKREQEKAGSLFLLSELLNTNNFELGYHITNKPFLKGRSEHISISHSHNKLAISINEKQPTGIDIELVRDKVLKIKHKFLSETELSFAGDNIDKLITFWAAKEAMYKVYGLKELDFKLNLLIEKLDGSTIFGRIDAGDFKKKYQLVCEDLEEYKLVYVLNEF